MEMERELRREEMGVMIGSGERKRKEEEAGNGTEKGVKERGENGERKRRGK